MENETIKNMMSKLTILYAEDNDIERDCISKTLEVYFKKVVVAKDGVEALRLLEKHRVQIVLAEYTIPKLSGCEVALHLRQKKCKIPVIIVSASSKKEHLLNSIKAGVIHYIEKPINLSNLQNAFKVAYNSLLDDELLEVVFDGKDCYYDRVLQIFYRAKKEIKLSKNEKTIFELLLQNRGYLVSKETIQSELFEDPIGDNALNNAIYRLRKKVGADIIETVQQYGFRIV